MQSFSSLSDFEFEILCSDIFARELGLHVEHFRAGRDQGIDFRWRTEKGWGVGQCKHYANSTFSDLKRAARDEPKKVEKLDPKCYKFITSQDLTIAQKEEVFEIFQKWMKSSEDVVSARDLDAMLRRNETIRRAHPKLWLHSGAELFLQINSGLHTRAIDLATRVAEDMKRFVATRSFAEAKKILTNEHVCVIAGSPGVGKTMLSHALIADSLAEGYGVREIVSNIQDAWTLFDPNEKQIFLYDDFLGQISLSERLEKNEDVGIIRFMNTISRSPNHRFVLTTREYILRESISTFSALSDMKNGHQYLLEVSGYSRSDRAKILYNHVWHSDLPADLRAAFSGGKWRRIVDHHGYSPRLIQYATASTLLSRRNRYLDEFVSILERPVRLWEQAYDYQIREEQRVLLKVMCLFDYADLEDLVAAVSAHGVPGTSVNARIVERSLKQLDQTFISVRLVGGDARVEFHSPAVREFILELLRSDRQALSQVVESAQSIDQLLRLKRAGLAEVVYNPIAKRVEMISSEPLPLHEVGIVFSSKVSDLFRDESPEAEAQLAEILNGPASLLPSIEWWKARLPALLQRWTSGLSDIGDAAQILMSPIIQSMPECREATLLDAVKARLEFLDFEYISEWNSALDIHERMLEHEDRDRFESAYYDYIHSEAFDAFTEGDFDELLDFADRVSSRRSRNLILEFEAKQIDAEPREDDDDDDYSNELNDDEPSLEEIDALFDRFSD